jgi:hypothetical protein
MRSPAKIVIAALIVVLAAVALSAGTASAGSSSRPLADRGAARAGDGQARKAQRRRAVRRRHARGIARRSAARRRRHERHRSVAATEPAVAPEPGPSSEPAPQPQPQPEPEPSPEPEAVAAPAPNDQILFDGGFDSGFRGWYVQSLDSRATLFSSGVFQGSQAARFEVRDGDVEPDTGSERSEVSGPTFDEGDDLYIRDAIRIPGSSSYSGPWQIVQQLHEESWSGSPGMALFLDEAGTLTLGAGDGSPTFWHSARLQHDRWYDLIYRVKLSRNSSAGFVEVWLDGVQQALAGNGARAYGQTIQAAQTYLKAGVYRSKSSTGTSLVEHDAIVVGTSYAAVSG